MDVCPLARGVMLPLGRNSYPLHYRVAFASSILPFPHACRLALRRTFPCGRRTGLPCSVLVTTNGVGALCPPVAWDAHDKETESPCTRYSALLAQAFQHLWLVFCDDVYRAFTWGHHTTWKVGRDKVHKRCPLRWQQQLQNVFTFAAPCQ